MWLQVRSGEEQGKAVLVDADSFVVGRDEACELTLDDARLSRRHAVLEPEPDGSVKLRDLGSSNGTYVNGKRVESTVLKGNEQIQLGNTVLVSSCEEPAQGRSPTVVGSVVRAGGEGPSAVYRLLVKRSRRATALGVAALAVAILAVALLAGVLLVRGEENAVEGVVADAAHGTVLVEALDQGARVQTGSGWVLDPGEGLVVTSAHVISGGTEFRVGAQGTSRGARVVAAAPCEDLAVLKVADSSGLAALPLGDQSSLDLGETVVAVGYPENASQEASLTSTTGVVSLVRSSYRDPALDVPHYSNVVQTDAAINPGNSGGPLLDLDGRLVGVTSARRTTGSGGRAAEGQNYAIGVDRVKRVVGVLRQGRSIGWSGGSFEYSAGGGLVAGPAVPGTGADKAGLGRTRAVVVGVNGVPVSSSLASYCDAVAGVRSRERVSFTILPPGARAVKTLAVTME